MRSSVLGALTFAAMSAVTVAANAQAVEVRIASHVSEASPLYENALLFVDEINKKLPGKFDFGFFPNGQLGKEPALIDNIKLGTLEMGMVGGSVLKLDDKLGLFDLPWLFKDRAHVVRSVKGELGRQVIARLEDKQNFIVLGIYESGFRHVINTKHSIKTPEDMKGLKIRVAGSKYKRDGFAAMGADPVPVAWQETFTAIQQGVVDGAEAALYGHYSANLYEIAENLSLTSHNFGPSFLIMSKAFFAKLSDEDQKIFRDVARDMIDEAYAQAARQEKGYLDKMAAQISVNDVDPTPFQVKAKSVYDNYTSQFGTDWLDLVRGK